MSLTRVESRPESDASFVTLAHAFSLDPGEREALLVALYGFLARRSSKEFLELYVGDTPGLLDRISEPGLMLSAMSEVGLVVRLHKLGLLPEENRKKFLETVSKYAVDGDDLSAMAVRPPYGRRRGAH